MQPRAAGLHRPHVGARRDLRGFAHHLHLGGGLVQAHVVQQVIERDEFVRRLRALPGLGADAVDPLHQPVIELGVAADRVVDARAPLDQPGEDVVDVTDGKGIVGAVLAHRPFLAGAQAVPEFALGVALAAEQHVLAVLAPGDQRDHRLRLGKAREVLEIAVLAVDVFHVPVADVHGGRRQDGDAVRLHLRHQRLAAPGVLRLGNAGRGHGVLLGTGISAGKAWGPRPAPCRIRRTATWAPRAGIPSLPCSRSRRLPTPPARSAPGRWPPGPAAPRGPHR